MTIDELRTVLVVIVSEYFKGATVAWAEQKAVKPTSPLIKLKLDNFAPTQHYINDVENGEQIKVKPFSVNLEVQLFTHGRKQTDNDGNIYYVNTAASDMVAFSHYLLSDFATELFDKYNISVRTEGSVTDISAVVDTTYEYRAMQQYVVNFVSESRGKSGIAPVEGTEFAPTPSGGGTYQLAELEIGSFEKVSDIKEEYH